MTRRNDKSFKVNPFYVVPSRTWGNSAKKSERSLKIRTRRINIDYMKISQDDEDNLRGITFHRSNNRFEDFRIGKKSFLCFG